MAAQYSPELEILYTDLALIDLYAEAGSADGGEGEMASSCPSSWLKVVNLLSPLPTDTTRRCPSEAGGEGRIFRGLLSSNGALGAGVEGEVEGEGDPPDPGGAGSSGRRWEAEEGDASLDPAAVAVEETVAAADFLA